MPVNVISSPPVEISFLDSLIQTMPTWFLQGGIVMWVLLLFSFITTIVTLERFSVWITYFPKQENNALQDCYAALNNHQKSEALCFSNTLETPALIMVKQGILALPFSPEKKMQAYAGQEVSLMSKGQSWLRLVFHSAPIIGLLGSTLVASSTLNQPTLTFNQALVMVLIPFSSGLLISLFAQLPYHLFQSFLKQLELHLTKVQSEFLYICQQKELITNKVSSIMQTQENSLMSNSIKPNAETETVAEHSEMPYHYDFKEGSDEVKVTIHTQEMTDIEKPTQKSLLDMYEDEVACKHEYYGVDEVALQEQQEKLYNNLEAKMKE